jgi:hypothetical protein
MVVVQTNNATFGHTDESAQQLAMSRLRAVEFGRSVVVAATSGISAVVAPDGSVHRSSELFTPAVFVEEIAQRRSTTVAERLGAWPEWLLAAVGAGAVLAAASDIRLLKESASFRFLFTKVGISGGDMGICWLLPRLVGLGRATEILMLGDRIGSHEALQMGLATRVVPDGDLDAAVEDYVRRFQEVAPWGLAMTKEMLNRAASMDYSSAVEMEAWTQTLLMTAGDFREFHAGFTGKRRPVFRGR